jgi:hypothetical protein
LGALGFEVGEFVLAHHGNTSSRGHRDRMCVINDSPGGCKRECLCRLVPAGVWRLNPWVPMARADVGSVGREGSHGSAVAQAVAAKSMAPLYGLPAVFLAAWVSPYTVFAPYPAVWLLGDQRNRRRNG